MITGTQWRVKIGGVVLRYIAVQCFRGIFYDSICASNRNSILKILKESILYGEERYILSISMQKLVDLVNSIIDNYHIDSSIIQNMQACLGKEMKVDGWISIILSNRECVVLEFDNGKFMNQGFVVNEQKVLKVIGNHQIGHISYNEDQSRVVVEGIVDRVHGTRFEGLVLKDEKEGKKGIPFGYGEMYEDDGPLLYKGIVINWQRFGYGTSFHDNGCVEYEGYWCDDDQFGIGIVFDRHGKLVNDCLWYNGIETDIEEYYGEDYEPLNIGIKYLELIDNCVLVDWDVSLLLNLESIEIGDEYFTSVKTFKINGLNRLKMIEIGCDSFTKTFCCGEDKSKSFHILNCESLESIQIGKYSFSDYAGDFELKNLPQLQSIQIGEIGGDSNNFHCSSFVIRGIELILNI